MSLRHLVLAGALALSSCATDTPEAPKKKNRGVGDTVHALVKDGAQEAGLSPIESRLAANAAKKLADNPEKIEAAVGNAKDYLDSHPEKRKELEDKAKEFLKENPELEAALGRFLK